MSAQDRWVTFDLDGTIFENRLRRYMMPGLEGAVLARGRRRVRVRHHYPGEHKLRSRLSAPWLRAIRAMARKSLPSRTHLYPDVKPGLRALRDMGYHLAAVTNGYRVYQEPLLEGLGILDLFERFISPETVGVAKPDPRIWTMGIAPNEGRIVLHVGDRLTDDILGAHHAGLPAAWLSRKHPHGKRALRLEAKLMLCARPEWTVTSLWGVVEHLREAPDGPGGALNHLAAPVVPCQEDRLEADH